MAIIRQTKPRTRCKRVGDSWSVIEGGGVKSMVSLLQECSMRKKRNILKQNKSPADITWRLDAIFCACCMFFEIRVKRGLIVNIIPLYIVPIYIYLYIFTCVFCTCILHMIDKWFLSQSVGFKLGQCFLSDGKSSVASNQRWINHDHNTKEAPPVHRI